MSPLALFLITKIVVTGTGIGIPFLVLPATMVERLSGFDASPPALFRLYGLAIVALLVGYGGGLHETLNGEFPWGAAAMGIVSNGGAALTLLITGQAKRMPLLSVFFAAIAAGLLWAVTNPAAALGHAL